MPIPNYFKNQLKSFDSRNRRNRINDKRNKFNSSERNKIPTFIFRTRASDPRLTKEEIMELNKGTKITKSELAKNFNVSYLTKQWDPNLMDLKVSLKKLKKNASGKIVYEKSKILQPDLNDCLKKLKSANVGYKTVLINSIKAKLKSSSLHMKFMQGNSSRKFEKSVNHFVKKNSIPIKEKSMDKYGKVIINVDTKRITNSSKMSSCMSFKLSKSNEDKMTEFGFRALLSKFPITKNNFYRANVAGKEADSIAEILEKTINKKQAAKYLKIFKERHDGLGESLYKIKIGRFSIPPNSELYIIYNY